MSKKGALSQNYDYAGHYNDNVWYDAERLITLVRQYSAKPLNVTEPVSTPEGLNIQLTSVIDGQQGSYFIPLNINALDKSFSNNNHWAGLYISKSKSGPEIKYLDTMGHHINEGVNQIIKTIGNISYNIENVLLGRSIQFVKQNVDEISIRREYRRLWSVFGLLYIMFSK